MQIQEINHFPNQDSAMYHRCRCRKSGSISQEECLRTTPNSETLISNIDSPIQPIQIVQPLISPFDPTE